MNKPEVLATPFQLPPDLHWEATQNGHLSAQPRLAPDDHVMQTYGLSEGNIRKKPAEGSISRPWPAFQGLEAVYGEPMVPQPEGPYGLRAGNTGRRTPPTEGTSRPYELLAPTPGTNELMPTAPDSRPDSDASPGEGNVRRRKRGLDITLAQQREQDEELKLQRTAELLANYGTAREAYVNVVAGQRSGIVRLEQSGGRIRKFLDKFHPLRNRKENKLKQAVQTAQANYSSAYKALADNIIDDSSESTTAPATAREVYAERSVGRLEDLDLLEGSILEAQRRQATDNNGLIGNWIARRVAKSKGLGRVFKVAAPAVVAGAAIGITAATAGVGPLAAAGIGVGVGYLGRRYGQFVAKRANKGMILTEQGQASNRHAVAASAHELRRWQIEAERRLDLDPTRLLVENDDIDHTIDVNQATERIVAENQHLMRSLRSIGGIAAGMGFGLGLAGVHAVHGLHHATPKPHNNSGGGNNSNNGGPQQGGDSAKPVTPANPANPETHTINLNDYPWKVAHGLTPGHEFDTLHKVIAQINTQQGTHLAVRNVHTAHGVTQMVMNGNQPLSLAQQRAFNQAMESMVNGVAP